MKLFTLRATSEEQKSDQALTIRAMLSLFLFFCVAVLTYKGFDAIFGINPDPEFKRVLFIVLMVGYSSFVPSIVKLGWKQLAPRIIFTTFFITIVLSAFMRLF